MLCAFERSLSEHVVAIANTEQRTPIAQLMFEADKTLVERVKAVHAPLSRILESLQEICTQDETRSAK